jgi:hypothetical protein
MLDRPADLLVADAGIAGRSLTGTRRVDRCAQACLVCLAEAPRDAYKQTPPSTRHEQQPLATGSLASPAAACAAQAKDRKRTTRGPPRPNSQIPSIASRGRESAPTRASNSASTRSALAAVHSPRGAGPPRPTPRCRTPRSSASHRQGSQRPVRRTWIPGAARSALA